MNNVYNLETVIKNFLLSIELKIPFPTLSLLSLLILQPDQIIFHSHLQTRKIYVIFLSPCSISTSIIFKDSYDKRNNMSYASYFLGITELPAVLFSTLLLSCELDL